MARAIDGWVRLALHVGHQFAAVAALNSVTCKLDSCPSIPIRSNTNTSLGGVCCQFRTKQTWRICPWEVKNHNTPLARVITQVTCVMPYSPASCRLQHTTSLGTFHKAALPRHARIKLTAKPATTKLKAGPATFNVHVAAAKAVCWHPQQDCTLYSYSAACAAAGQVQTHHQTTAARNAAVNLHANDNGKGCATEAINP